MNTVCSSVIWETSCSICDCMKTGRVKVGTHITLYDVLIGSSQEHMCTLKCLIVLEGGRFRFLGKFTTLGRLLTPTPPILWFSKFCPKTAFLGHFGPFYGIFASPLILLQPPISWFLENFPTSPHGQLTPHTIRHLRLLLYYLYVR